jgi:hypothetical protein
VCIGTHYYPVTVHRILLPPSSRLSKKSNKSFLITLRMTQISPPQCRYVYIVGRDSVVGIATRYGMDGLGIESQWGARFSAPVQTGPGAQPASCTVGTESFDGVKRLWGVVLTTHPYLSAEVIKGSSYVSTHPLGLSGLL